MRPVEPDMLLLWARLESVCASIDHQIRAMVGAPRGFTIMIHPDAPGCATLSVTNQTENVEAVREWLRNMDLKREGSDGRLADAVATACYGARQKYLDVCRANLAEHEADSYAAYAARMPTGLPLLSEDEWTRWHDDHLHGLRENIRINRIRKRSE